MSNPLPPASGIPVKTIVRAPKGRDAETTKLSKELTGEINQFVAAARQNLGPLEVAGAVRELPQGRLQFFKNNGQEQLVVTLRPPAPPEPEEQPRPVVPLSLPDYCVVDIVVPRLADANTYILAKGVGPELFLEAPFADELEFDFFSFDTPSYSEDKEPGKALMRYARYETTDTVVPITDRVSSLRFDLRELAIGQEIEVEIWGRYGLGSSAFIPLGAATGVGYLDGDDPFWLDGSGAPHSSPPIDPLGNPVNVSIGFGIETFPILAFNTAFNAFLQADQWDETIYDTDNPLAGTQGSSGTRIPVYAQRRFDPDTGEEIALRLLSYTSSFVLAYVPRPGGGGGTVPRFSWTISFLERERLGALPPPDNVVTVDVVSGFYYGNPQMQALSTEGTDGEGIWSPNTGIPERQKIAEAQLYGEETADSFEFTDESGSLTRLGNIVVRRDSARAVFTPA